MRAVLGVQIAVLDTDLEVQNGSGRLEPIALTALGCKRSIVLLSVKNLQTRSFLQVLFMTDYQN